VDEIKSQGNEAYHKGDFYQALDFYEQVHLYLITTSIVYESLQLARVER
jgi:hypothetical protein